MCIWVKQNTIFWPRCIVTQTRGFASLLQAWIVLGEPNITKQHCKRPKTIRNNLKFSNLQCITPKGSILLRPARKSLDDRRC
jgi:hypothetical protein